MMDNLIGAKRRMGILFFLALGLSMPLHAQNDGMDDGLNEAPPPVAEAAEDVDAPEEFDDDLDFLFDDPADAPEAPAAVDEAADIEPAEVPADPEEFDDDLDFLFDAPAEDPEAVDDLDFLFDAPDDPVEEDIDFPEPPVAPDDMPVPADPVADAEVDPDEPEMAPEEARLLALQEEIRRQADEIEARRRVTEARIAADNEQYRQALRFYDVSLQRLPVRPRTEELRASIRRERLEVMFYVLQEELRAAQDKETAEETRERILMALREAPDHRGFQRLESAAGRTIARLTLPEPEPWETEEVRRRQTRVRAMLDEARGLLRRLELDEARKLFESVLSIDPDNVEAMRYLRELHEQRYLLASLEREATTRDMMATVRDTWRPREYQDVDPRDRPDDDRAVRDPGIMVKLDSITIPEIEFRQANIHDVVDFLVRASIDEDPEPDPEKRGVNIILNLGRDAARRDTDLALPDDDPFAALAGPVAPTAALPGDDISVTFRARWITLRQALDIITQVAGLKYHIEGNVIMIVPLDAVIDRIINRMYPVEPSLIDLVERERDAAPARDRDPFRRLDAPGIDREREPVQQFFEQMGVKFPPGSSIAYRSSIGQLVVANTAENLVVFEDILGRLNVVPNQVEIEARFVEVNQSDLEEFGLQWMLDDNWQLLQRSGQDNLPLSARERVEIQSNAGRGGFTRGLRFGGTGQTPVSGGSVGSIMTISSILTNPEFSMVINALAQKGHADVLSAPKITTRAGLEANIRVVTEYIYPTDYRPEQVLTAERDPITGARVEETVSVPEAFETREVGVVLSVLPEVSPDDNMINLTLRPEITDEPIWRNYGTANRPFEQPFFPTRTLNTQISIYDGATVVMGGLITEHMVNVDDKIPLLGDLPLLGRLFRSTHKRSQKRNLMIFVTARLVDPAGRPVRQPRAEDMLPPLPRESE